MKRTENKMYNFMLFFISQTVSELGTSMTGFATVIWMYSNSGQVMSSSLLAICSTVPYLTVSLFGGAVVDKTNKKKIMLICDSIAAVGSVILLSCYILGYLQLWVLCLVNVINGFMNAFQNPASQVAVTLLVDEKDYARIGGIQSTMGAMVGIFQPILATTILNVFGLQWILIVDLCTFFFAGNDHAGFNSPGVSGRWYTGRLCFRTIYEEDVFETEHYNFSGWQAKRLRNRINICSCGGNRDYCTNDYEM